MSRQVSVAMTQVVEQRLVDLLVRKDRQEDLCLASYQLSTGATRSTALIASVISPLPGDRHVHGNATVTGDYIVRGSQNRTTAGPRV